jgi:iron complex transport system permease protein
MLGSAVMIDPSACLLMTGVLGISLLVGAGWSRVLDALNLGEDTARSLGMPLTWARWSLLAVLSLATGTAVAKWV